MELEIRGRNLPLSPSLQDLVQRRLAFALDRFGPEIRRVDVRLADINGPRGGVDKRCQVEVTLAHGGHVRAEGTDAGVRDAIDRAAHRTARRVTRRLGRAASLR
ncbi:MAG: HPF/RaiA family ribosome-associated protein [Nannocystaceae bacterium]